MASGDKFLFNVARHGLHSGLAGPAEIVYRQHVLADCVAQPGVVRNLYDVSVAAITGEKHLFGWTIRDSPDSILYRARQMMQLYLDMFRRLRGIADAHAAGFRSEGFTRFFAMLAEELADGYLAEIETQIGELAFRRGTLISARLGPGAKGAGYLLRRHPEQGWRDRIPGLNKSGYTFFVPERDEAGMKALSDLTSRGLNSTSSALAQSADHVRCLLRDAPRRAGLLPELPEPAGPADGQGPAVPSRPVSPVPAGPAARPLVGPRTVRRVPGAEPG